MSNYNPNIVFVDMPPIAGTADALALVPHVDTTILIVDATRTTPQQIEQSRRELERSSTFLGIVLNKTIQESDSYYYYAN